MSLPNTLAEVAARFEEAAQRSQPSLRVDEVGFVERVDEGVIAVRGLPRVGSFELVRFPEGGETGIAFNLDREGVGVILLNSGEHIGAGSEAVRTHRVLDVPVGAELLGRVVDPLGTPLDGGAAPRTSERWPAERPAPPIIERAPVDTPLHTGIVAVDSMIPVGRGQRELLIGDRQTGKTSLAVDTILNQRDEDVVCIYCAIGQQSASTAKTIDDLRTRGAMEHTVVVVADGEVPPGLRFAAPYAATTIGEWFMEKGRDVLVVYDDLTQHARAYREVSLLLKRPPGREAFPGDVFYIHSRLLERSTHLRAERGGGSLTAIPIVETEAGDLSAYIPTNIISITDGQIYLSPELAHKGLLPAVDVGRSVSRVGGRAQLPAYRSLSGALKLAYAQFEELETFSRFGTRLDPDTRQTLEHGRRVREVLRQPRYAPISPAGQMAMLVAVNAGLLDDVPARDVPDVTREIRKRVEAEHPEWCAQIEEGAKLQDVDTATIRETAKRVVARERGWEVD